MYNKRSLASEDITDIPDEKRFRHDMVDIFLNNELSSARSARRQQNKMISRLFFCPGFSTSCCKMDWLRAVDLGITPDWLGSLFF